MLKKKIDIQTIGNGTEEESELKIGMCGDRRHSPRETGCRIAKSPAVYFSPETVTDSPASLNRNIKHVEWPRPEFRDNES